MNTPAGGVTLPELPEAAFLVLDGTQDPPRDEPVYTADQMREYARAALAGEWRDVRESLPDYEGANEVRQHLVYHPACFGLRIVTEHPSWWNREDPRGREFDGEKVSHWMPLPAAPLPKEPGHG